MDNEHSNVEIKRDLPVEKPISLTPDQIAPVAAGSVQALGPVHQVIGSDIICGGIPWPRPYELPIAMI